MRHPQVMPDPSENTMRTSNENSFFECDMAQKSAQSSAATLKKEVSSKADPPPSGYQWPYDRKESSI